MSRIAKLYDSAAADPGSLSFREFERLLAAFGFEHIRTNGSHRHYKHPRVPEQLTVLPDGKQVKRYLVRQLLDMIDRHGLTLKP